MYKYFKYYLNREQETKAECRFISDKVRTACVSNGLKNDLSYEFIGEIINVVYKPRKSKLKFI
jgi:hypothetical protein